MRKGITIVLFLILLLYFLVTFGKQTPALKENIPLIEEKKEPESLYWVTIVDKRGKSRIGLETYLWGILGSTIDAGYELETLKAQAVLLRSSFYYEMEKQKETEIDSKKMGFVYRTEESWKKVWGAAFTEYNEKCRRAVKETEGLVLAYEGKNIPGAFCGVSAGETRKSNVEEYAYLRGVKCPNSMEAENYLQMKSFPAETWESLEIIETDENGYALTLLVNGEIMRAENFKEKYQLASTNLTIHRGEDYTLETRGVGHGWGMDQYYANTLILKGEKKDYMELISFFYQNITFEKTASYKS